MGKYLKTTKLPGYLGTLGCSISERMNFYNHHIRSIFKSHSISVTFKFCAVLVATWFKHAQSNTHCAKFESNTDRMTFECAPKLGVLI